MSAPRRPRPPLARDLRPRPQAARADRAAAPVPGPRGADVRRAGDRHRRRAGAAAAGQAGDRQGHRARQHDRAGLDRRRVPGLRARLLGRDLRPDLPRRLDRPARAAGPADPALRAPAGHERRVLLAQARRRADLAPVQRRRGARHARLRRHRDAVRLLADADRHGGDPVHARRRARADHLHRLPGPRARVAASSGSSPPTPTAPRARRSRRSPAICRRRSRASASCARSRRSRATCGASRSSTRRTAART